eukprot:jgi/Botrbrau1/19493/Bobra.0571s0002.1
MVSGVHHINNGLHTPTIPAPTLLLKRGCNAPMPHPLSMFFMRQREAPSFLSSPLPEWQLQLLVSYNSPPPPESIGTSKCFKKLRFHDQLNLTQETDFCEQRKHRGGNVGRHWDGLQIKSSTQGMHSQEDYWANSRFPCQHFCGCGTLPVHLGPKV